MLPSSEPPAKEKDEEGGGWVSLLAQQSSNRGDKHKINEDNDDISDHEVSIQGRHLVLRFFCSKHAVFNVLVSKYFIKYLKKLMMI